MSADEGHDHQDRPDRPELAIDDAASDGEGRHRSESHTDEPGGTVEVAEGDDASRARPLVERLGMAAIALVLAALFGAMAAAAFAGGEPFLGVMAGTGSLMTLWVGALTLRRG